MSDLIHLGSSGLFAYQKALNIAGENIANAGVAGYSRRTAELQDATPLGPGFPLLRQLNGGGGVDVARIMRSYNAFLAMDARQSASDAAQTNVRARWLEGLQSVLNTETQSVGATLTKYFTAAQDVAATPTSIAARETYLAAAITVADSFQSSADGMSALAASIHTEATQDVMRVNQLASSIARLNTVQHRTAAGTSQAASLNDERDRLIDDLGELIPLHVSQNADGTVDLAIAHANGPKLVAFDKTSLLQLRGAPGGLALAIGAFGQSTPVSPPQTGKLAGHMEADRIIADRMNELDAIAIHFAMGQNTQHQRGIDLNGNPGQPIFATRNITVAPSPANRGQASVDVSLGTSFAPVPAGYILSYSSSATTWTLARADNSASVSGTGTLQLDGMDVSPTGAPQDGDQFTLSPQDGASGMRLLITDGNSFAASAPWISSIGGGNLSAGKISLTSDASASLPLLSAYNIVFTSDTTYDIVEPGTSTILTSNTYQSGAAIPVNGFSFTFSGDAPKLGDTYVIRKTPAGFSDNANIREMIALGDGPQSVGQLYGKSVTSAATALQNTHSLHEANTAMLDQANNARAANSGVNLDEEAAKLVEFQQSYQASAKIISVAREIFNSILEIA